MMQLKPNSFKFHSKVTNFEAMTDADGTPLSLTLYNTLLFHFHFVAGTVSQKQCT